MMSPVVVVIGLVAMCSASPSLYFGGPQYYSGYYAAPAAVVSPIKSQYHTQNEFGQYAYGYNDGFSSKSETKHANGLTEGAYSYVDPNGVLQQYKYVSDENGYRVSGTNLPVAPAVPAVEVPVVPAVESVVEVKSAVPVQDAAPAPEAVAEPILFQSEIPQQVQDTPEVAAAKAAHQIAYDEAKKAADASPAEDEPSSDAVVQVSAEAPAAPAAPAAAPAAPAAPAADYVSHFAPAPVLAAAPAPVASVASYSYHPSAAYAAYPSYAAVPAHAPVASYAYGPVASYAYAAAPAPSYAYTAPFASGSYSPVHSQYHSQDEFGQYSYGYNSGSSSKAEVKTLDGVTRGGYSYVDANGQVQHYNYVSDPVNGFRVAGTNLPAANAL